MILLHFRSYKHNAQSVLISAFDRSGRSPGNVVILLSDVATRNKPNASRLTRQVSEATITESRHDQDDYLDRHKSTWDKVAVPVERVIWEIWEEEEETSQD